MTWCPRCGEPTNYGEYHCSCYPEREDLLAREVLRLREENEKLRKEIPNSELDE